MAKRIVWSSNALSDRIQILNYWFQRNGNKHYSKKLDNALKAAIKRLASFPEMGIKMKDRQERYLVHGAYQIYYVLVEDELRIVHLWDSRRNPDELKFDL